MPSDSEGPTMSSQTQPPNQASESCHDRCARCNSNISPEKKKNGRNLVVCIDGTSNEFGQNNTNVVKLFAKISPEMKGRKQCAYYSSGIGTRPNISLSRKISDWLDMAIAWNVEEIVKDAYGWLARKYEEGDQIYLFGFSRGAYQVRVLAAMIHEVGLIRTPTEKQIGTAYNHYSATGSGQPATKQAAREFKNTFSHENVGVHFVGVWDTVSSIGFIRVHVYLSASSTASHACYFRHALALDECRVKFMPEYLHEVRSKYNDQSAESEHTSNTVVEELDLTGRTHSFEKRGDSASHIKEVWFAGSHSDVGGKTRPGDPFHAGNVSLLWMRREVAACGLMLKPTDIVWVPDDLDSGTTISMNPIWRIIEYLPMNHQVSFSGAGDYAYGFHRCRPRRIIPGQKVHASIVYANAYKPKASLEKDFDMPIVHADPGVGPDGPLWETGLFDDDAAQHLVTNLGAPGQHEVAPIYLDRLMFMLRFDEGKKSVRNVENWEKKFIGLIEDPDCTPLVRLVAIAACYEATCGSSQPLPELQPDTLSKANRDLLAILRKPMHRDRPRVVALLRPLTKHEILRESILNGDVLDLLVPFFDAMIGKDSASFVQAMDGLSCLLECKDTQQTMIKGLGELWPHPVFPGLPQMMRILDPRLTRLSRILMTSDPCLLVAALRMVMTLARLAAEVPEAKDLCFTVKLKLRRFAIKDEMLVGPLAVEILLILYDEREREKLDIQNRRVRANIARALVRLNRDGHSSAAGGGATASSGKQILSQIFGLESKKLEPGQRKLIGELKNAVEIGKDRERTAATLTLLKLCDTRIIRKYLIKIQLLDIFVDQLRKKKSALLAAYALSICLKHPDMKKSIKDNDQLPGNIVYMLRHDYFDDTVDSVEGFQIFGHLMERAELREKMTEHDITAVLSAKLEKDKPNETRVSLICLDVFRSFDGSGKWTNELVEKGLEHLRNPDWEKQKTGVTMLFALAQTEQGEMAIGIKISDIIGMLLPKANKPTQSTLAGRTHRTPSDVAQEKPHAEFGNIVTGQSVSTDVPQRPSSMLGPSCALRLFAQNKTLRERTRKTPQYGRVKYLFLSGTLVNERDTSVWRIKSPNRADVTDSIDKMIKAVDGELSEEGLLSMGDAVLPHVNHWKKLLRKSAVIVSLPALLGVSLLAVVGAILSVAYVVVSVPVALAVSVALSPTLFLSVGAYELCNRIWRRTMHRGAEGNTADEDEEADAASELGHGGPSDGHIEGESSHHELGNGLDVAATISNPR